MKLSKSENDLVGKWVVTNGKVRGDDVTQRIKWLISNQLVELGRDPTGWDVLYRDPSDRRLWELTYPESEMQGGGPPRLQCITAEEARIKYGDKIVRVETGVKP